MSKSSVIVLPLELVDSEAFQSLNGTAIRVLLHFFRKRQLSEIKSGNGKRSGYVIRNNGEIVYPYSEALKQGMYRQRFSAALKMLMDRGFISVERGGGLFRESTFYRVHCPDSKEPWRRWKQKQKKV